MYTEYAYQDIYIVYHAPLYVCILHVFLDHLGLYIYYVSILRYAYPLSTFNLEMKFEYNS